MEQRIGHEIKSLCNLLKRQIRHNIDEEMTPMQGKILFFVFCKSKEGDVYQKDIEKMFSIRGSTATGMLQLLEQRGLLVRVIDPNDARQKKLVLTSKACKEVAIVEKSINQMEEQMRIGIAEEDLEVFFCVMRKIRENVQNYVSEG